MVKYCKKWQLYNKQLELTINFWGLVLFDTWDLLV